MPRQSVTVDPSFSARLKELREARGLSLRRLGKAVHCSHGFLWDLEAGLKRPSANIAASLDRTLGAEGELSCLVREVSADTITRPAAMTDPLPGLEFATDWRRGFDVATDLWRGDMQRRVALQGAGFSAAAFMPPAMRWLMAPLDEQPTSAGERLVSASDIELVRQITSTFRELDNRFGGGHVRDSVIRFLNGDVAELINGRYDADTGRALLAAAAETTQLAAWTSYDAGMHGLAQRYLVQALRFSAGSGDKALGAEILAAMSHQASYKQAPAEAVDLARAASRSAAEAGVPAIQAESAVLEAQGHAVRGDEAACAKALDTAEKLFDRADRTHDPQWIGYFDEAYLSAKFGHCFLTVGRGDIAQRFARRSLDMDTQHFARGHQFNLALLALAYAQTGELEEAGRIGLQAIDAAERLHSTRARDYLTVLADRLGRHVGLATVRDFTDRVRTVLLQA